MDIFQKMKDYLPKGVRISKIVGLQNTEYFMSKAVRVSSLYQNIDITRWNGMSVIRKQCIPNIKTILQLICPNDWQNHFETGSSKCTLDSITKRQLQDVYRKLMISKHNLKKPLDRKSVV